MLFWATVNLIISAGFGYLIKAPLVRAYLILNFVLIIQPMFLWVFFGLAHPLFQPGHPNYVTGLVFQSIFNFILCLAFLGFMRTVPRSRMVRRNVLMHRLNVSENYSRIILIIGLLAVLGMLGKISLGTVGAFRMNEGGGGAGPFLQLLKAFAGFDLISIVLLGEVRLSAMGRARNINIFLFALIAIALGFAFWSGSRSQVITVIIITFVVYRDIVWRNWIFVLPGLASILPTIFVVFPFLGYYRNLDFNFSEALYQLQRTGLDAWDFMLDVLVTRLNYNETYVRVFDVVDRTGPSGGAVYWNNVIGIIPRAIWPGKPQISNNSKDLGHELGLVTADDTTTSIGLQVVGEAFYEYGWLGLWVAGFQALVFVLIHKNFFFPRNRAAMTIYTILCFYVLQRDGYFAVVPGLIWQALSFSFFFGVIAFLLPRKKWTSHDSVPRRFAY